MEKKAEWVVWIPSHKVDAQEDRMMGTTVYVIRTKVGRHLNKKYFSNIRMAKDPCQRIKR